MGWQAVYAAFAQIGTTIINSGGIFVYNGTPALGNLLVAIVNFTGTDSFGNAVVEGLNVDVGVISGTSISGSTITGTAISGGTITGAIINGSVVNAGDTVINSSGTFVYSGTPAAGNLIVSIAKTAGTDAFNNNYLGGGVTSYDNSLLIALNHAGALIQWYSFTAQPSAVFTAMGNITSNSAGMLNLSTGGGVTSLTITDTGTGNLYRSGHLVVGNLGSNQLVNSATFALYKSISVLPGNYRIRALIQYNSGSTAAGLPIFGWAHSSTAGISLWVSKALYWNAAGSGFTGQYTHAAGYPADFNGPTMAANSTYFYEMDAFVVVSSAGVIDLAASCSVATDTYSIMTGSFIELIPE